MYRKHLHNKRQQLLILENDIAAPVLVRVNLVILEQLGLLAPFLFSARCNFKLLNLLLQVLCHFALCFLNVSGIPSPSSNLSIFSCIGKHSSS